MRFQYAYICAIIAGASIFCAATLRSARAADSVQKWGVSDISKLPDDAWGRTVRSGRMLITNTASLIGPEVKNPKMRYSGNNLSCESCHLEAGTKEFGLPFQGVYASFPNYRARSGTVGTIEDRIQGCMVRSMNGKPLPLGGQEMTAIVAYLKFLSMGYAVGGEFPGRGPGFIPELKRAASPLRGRTIYAQTCAACHGVNGQGKRAGHIGDANGYIVPPLWGPDSFNDGAGMSRLADAANFIHSNMPNGTSWNQPVLRIDDAWDVAAFVVSQPRPHKAHLEQDYPNRLEKPVDVPYGPYADVISPRQHKFGPFAPIRVAVSNLKKEGRSK